MNKTRILLKCEKKINSGVKLLFVDCTSSEIIYLLLSIIKNKGNSEEAALYLTSPENVKNLEKEIEEKNKKLKQEKKEDDNIICLEQDKINLLIDILDNNDEEISNNIWQLLSEIKYPDNLIRNVIAEDLTNLLNERNINKVILNLKLINSLIFDDDFCKFNKLKKE